MLLHLDFDTSSSVKSYLDSLSLLNLQCVCKAPAVAVVAANLWVDVWPWKLQLPVHLRGDAERFFKTIRKKEIEIMRIIPEMDVMPHRTPIEDIYHCDSASKFIIYYIYELLCNLSQIITSDSGEIITDNPFWLHIAPAKVLRRWTSAIQKNISSLRSSLLYVKSEVQCRKWELMYLEKNYLPSTYSRCMYSNVLFQLFRTVAENSYSDFPFQSCCHILLLIAIDVWCILGLINITAEQQAVLNSVSKNENCDVNSFNFSCMGNTYYLKDFCSNQIFCSIEHIDFGVQPLNSDSQKCDAVLNYLWRKVAIADRRQVRLLICSLINLNRFIMIIRTISTHNTFTTVNSLYRQRINKEMEFRWWQ